MNDQAVVETAASEVETEAPVLAKVMVNIEPDVLLQVEDYRRYRPGEIVSRNIAIVELVKLGIAANLAAKDQPHTGKKGK